MNAAEPIDTANRVRPRLLVALGLGAFVVFAVATLPARIAFSWIAPDNVQAAGLSGTVWNGQARAIAIGTYRLGRTRWHARPYALLMLRAAYTLKTELPGGAIEGNVAIRPGGTVVVDDLRGVLPVAVLDGLVPIAQIDGRVGLSIESARLVDGWPQRLIGTIDVANLVVTAPQVVDLGTFQLSFDDSADSDSGPVGIVTDIESPLTTEGTVALGEGRSWSVTLQMTPKPGAPQPLTDALTFLTGPPANGSHRFAADGVL